jgi:hypothetical protein
MRSVWLATAVVAIALGANPAGAEPRVISVAPAADAPQQPAKESDFQKYRGFMYDLTEYDGRKDVVALTDNLKHQLDMVENAGFSPKILDFFRTIPLIATETDCLDIGAGIACYSRAAPTRGHTPLRGVTMWDHDKQRWTNPDIVDLAADSGLGVIMLRPSMTQYTDDPVLLHEFLHAYHNRLMPNGFDNLGIKGFYTEAKSKDYFGKKSYTVFNDREFFAVTASIFLAGKESMHEPKTRAKLKEKMPDYYKYLVGVFGFDPDPSLPTPPDKDKEDKDKASTPVASAN